MRLSEIRHWCRTLREHLVIEEGDPQHEFLRALLQYLNDIGHIYSVDEDPDLPINNFVAAYFRNIDFFPEDGLIGIFLNDWRMSSPPLLAEVLNLLEPRSDERREVISSFISILESLLEESTSRAISPPPVLVIPSSTFSAEAEIIPQTIAIPQKFRIDDNYFGCVEIAPGIYGWFENGDEGAEEIKKADAEEAFYQGQAEVVSDLAWLIHLESLSQETARVEVLVTSPGSEDSNVSAIEDGFHDLAQPSVRFAQST